MSDESGPEDEKRDQLPVNEAVQPVAQRSGIHPMAKLMLIVFLGIPAVLAGLALLVLGACFLGGI